MSLDTIGDRKIPSLQDLFAADLEASEEATSNDGEPTDSEEELSESEGEELEGDEPEGDEPDDEPSDDDAADEEAEDDESEELEAEIDGDAKVHSVRIDGKDEQWSLNELKRSASREGHWTQRMQQVSERERAADAKLADADARLAEYSDVLPKFRKALEDLTGEPDFAELRKTLTPEQYASAVADHQVRARNIERLKREEERVAEEQRQRQDAAFARYAQEQQRLLFEAVPEWKTKPDVAQKELAEIGRFAMSQGWTEQELASLTDHRAIKMLRMAWQHSKGKAALPALKKKVKAAKPAAANSSARTAKPASADVAARKRLAQTGKPRDAVPFFERYLESEERDMRRSQRGRR